MTRGPLATLLGVGLLAAALQPALAHSPEEVQALVERAADYIREHGQQQAFADFNRPDGGFVDGELYIFCNDISGVQLANGGNPKMVGKNLSGLRDFEGRLTTADINRIGQTVGHGWYEYLWPNPAKGRIERKTTYVLRIDDRTVCASGYFKPDQR
ncbi:MAG TPA: cache domain-containing protein [Acetobacteraceae bacterium]|nr:cache domain-containing protein [Acetobacteraceae bacterium]